jgi:hypothetical protein
MTTASVARTDPSPYERNFRAIAWNSASQLSGRDDDLYGLRELLKVDIVFRVSVRREVLQSVKGHCVSVG